MQGSQQSLMECLGFVPVDRAVARENRRALGREAEDEVDHHGPARGYERRRGVVEVTNDDDVAAGNDEGRRAPSGPVAGVNDLDVAVAQVRRPDRVERPALRLVRDDRAIVDGYLP